MNIDEELVLPEQLNTHYKVFLNLIYTSAWLSNKIQKELKSFKLTMPQYNVLLILKRNEGVPLNAFDIQKRMIHSDCNSTRIIEKLIEKDFVKKETCNENRRKINVFITKKGLQILKRTAHVNLNNISVIEHIFDSEEDAKNTSVIFDKIREQFTELSLKNYKSVGSNPKGL